MQTNREDVADRYKEIRLPAPRSVAWAKEVSAAFRDYFTTMATAKAKFTDSVRNSKFEYVANVYSAGDPPVAERADKPPSDPAGDGVPV